MKLFSILPAVTMAFLAMPIAAWADRNPDFDDDAKPILSMQPGLLEYVEARFDVKDTGKAMHPGDDDRPPLPPFMFKAKPRGTPGPYSLMLLIEPGPINHILNVVDMTKAHVGKPSHVAPQPEPYVANRPAPQSAPSPAPSSMTKTVSTPTHTKPAPPVTQEITSDTPSGPIPASSNNSGTPTTAPSLEPAPDPAPTAH